MSGRGEKFEDLVAWQKARVLVRDINRVTRTAPLKSDRSLVSQMRRAAVSIMANLAEGFDRGGRREFHQFIVVAKGSCAELRSLLYVAVDDGALPSEEFERLNGMCVEVSRILAGLRAAVARQRTATAGASKQ